MFLAPKSHFLLHASEQPEIPHKCWWRPKTILDQATDPEHAQQADEMFPLRPNDQKSIIAVLKLLQSFYFTLEMSNEYVYCEQSRT